MKLKNGAEYIDSLRRLKPVIYYKGERIKDVTRHSATASHVSIYRDLKKHTVAVRRYLPAP